MAKMKWIWSMMNVYMKFTFKFHYIQHLHCIWILLTAQYKADFHQILYIVRDIVVYNMRDNKSERRFAFSSLQNMESMKWFWSDFRLMNFLWFFLPKIHENIILFCKKSTDNLSKSRVTTGRMLNVKTFKLLLCIKEPFLFSSNEMII